MPKTLHQTRTVGNSEIYLEKSSNHLNFDQHSLLLLAAGSIVGMAYSLALCFCTPERALVICKAITTVVAVTIAMGHAQKWYHIPYYPYSGWCTEHKHCKGEDPRRRYEYMSSTGGSILVYL